MKLSIENLREIGCLPGYHVPSYDIKRVRRNTIETPVWLHFGGGNLFRAFQAADVQELIERDFMTTGVITCDSYDDEIVDVYHRTDDLSVQVILNAEECHWQYCEKLKTRRGQGTGEGNIFQTIIADDLFHSNRERLLNFG